VVGQVVFRGGRDTNNASNDPAYATLSDGRVVRWSATGIDGNDCAADVYSMGAQSAAGVPPVVTAPVVITDPFADQDLILGADADGRLHALADPPAPPVALEELAGWPVTLAGPVRAPPAVGALRGIYVATENGVLHALRSVFAEERWRMDLEDAPSGSPLVARGAVFVATQDGTVTAFERGEDPPSELWWSRQGANARGTASTPTCASVSFAEAAGWWSWLLLFAAWRRRARRGGSR
jgi:outer membrane protein assembly factor BamB